MSVQDNPSKFRLERARRFQKRVKDNPDKPTHKIVARLAKEYCVSERTVWRDLKLKVDLNIPHW